MAACSFLVSTVAARSMRLIPPPKATACKGPLGEALSSRFEVEALDVDHLDHLTVLRPVRDTEQVSEKAGHRTPSGQLQLPGELRACLTCRELMP